MVNGSSIGWVICRIYDNFVIIVGAPLPEIIKWFKSQTTNAYIRWVKEGLLLPFDKHIWQRNYYEHVIRNDQDLDETRAYIQYNPLKAWLLETKE